MIPLALVTGFLGSGKTTLLKQLTHRYRSRKIVYLVNEFSARDVDAALLGRETENVVSIAGGSIFCRCLVTEFLEQLGKLANRFGTPSAPVEGVVVEASGIANPSSVYEMLREGKLDNVYRLSSVLAVVDPGSFQKLLHTLPNIRAQIETASRILINKIDLHPLSLTRQIEALVKDLNPRAQITCTIQCAADISLFGDTLNPISPPLPTACGSSAPGFASFHIRLDRELDLDRFRHAAIAIHHGLCRIKGFVNHNGRRFHLDYSASGWNIEETQAEEEPSLIFIVESPCKDAIRQLVHDVRAGHFNTHTQPLCS